MAKQIIIGVESGTYKNKQTGELDDYVVLHTVKKNMRCAGIATEELWFGKEYRNGYDTVHGECNGDFTQLVNRYVSIERGSRGFIEDMEFGDKADDAVMIEV